MHRRLSRAGRNNSFLVDDIIDTAGTICKAAALLKEAGGLSVYGIATHGVFSGPAMERLSASVMEEIWVTDSIPQTANQSACAKLKVISIAPLIAEAIKRLHDEQSLSKLFKHSLSVREAMQKQGYGNDDDDDVEHNAS